MRWAIETAEVLSHALGQSYQITDALHEYDCGILEGKSNAKSWQLHQEIANDWLLYQDWECRPNQGKSFLDIKKRFLPFIETLAKNHSLIDSHILLISHGGVFKLMLFLVLTNIEVIFILK